MSKADLILDALAEEVVVSRVLADPRPVVFVDTCCLGDVFRRMLEGKTDFVRNTIKAIQSNQTKHICHYLFSEQVVREFSRKDQFVKREIDSLNTPIKHWNNAVDVCADINGDFLVENLDGFMRLDLGQVQGFYTMVLERIAELFKMGFIIKPSEDSIRWGASRQSLGKRPAQLGKDSYGDCIICGSALNVMRALREKGFPLPAYFTSSNIKDYAQGTQLHSDLVDEFGECKMSYCQTVLEAYGVIVKGTNKKGTASIQEIRGEDGYSDR